MFKDITSNFRASLGIELDGVIIYGNVSGGKKNHKKDSLDAKQTEETTKGATTETSSAITTDITTTNTDSLSPTPAETVPVDEDELDDFDEGILSGGILVYKNRGIPVYYGSFAAGQNYASFVNAYKADLGEGVNVYSLVAPTAQSFYMPRKYAEKYGSEEENLINIREYLNGVTELMHIMPFYLIKRKIYIQEQIITGHHLELFILHKNLLRKLMFLSLIYLHMKRLSNLVMLELFMAGHRLLHLKITLKILSITSLLINTLRLIMILITTLTMKVPCL